MNPMPENHPIQPLEPMNNQPSGKSRLPQLDAKGVVEVQPAEGPLRAAFRRIEVARLLRHEGNKGGLCRHVISGAAHLEPSRTGQRILQDHKWGISTTFAIPAVSRAILHLPACCKGDGKGVIPHRDAQGLRLAWRQNITKQHEDVTYFRLASMANVSDSV